MYEREWIIRQSREIQPASPLSHAKAAFYRTHEGQTYSGFPFQSGHSEQIRIFEAVDNLSQKKGVKYFPGTQNGR